MNCVSFRLFFDENFGKHDQEHCKLMYGCG